MSNYTRNDYDDAVATIAKYFLDTEVVDCMNGPARPDIEALDDLVLAIQDSGVVDDIAFKLLVQIKKYRRNVAGK